MWLYPEGYYGAPQLNPSWLASWVLAAAIGVSYSARLIMDERLQLAFPALEQSRIYVLKDRLPSSFTRAIGFAAVAVARFWAVYFIFGWGIYRAVCAVLVRVMSTSSYAVGNPLFSLRANAFWLFSGTLTVLIWEFAHQLFEVIATEPTHINELSLDRNACLVNGLRHSSSQLIQHLAYQELYRLAMFRPDQRSELLTDIDRSTGTMWSQVSAECIGVVKAATSQLAAQNPAKSAKASAATAKPVPGGAGSQEPQRNRGAPMKDILQRNKGSSHGAGAGQSAAAALAGAQSTSTASQSDIFGPEAQGLEKYVLTVLRDALLQSALGQRILSRSLRARSTTAFANFQQQVWAVRSLMRLVECSIKDDEYGVVQADLATVLGTLLAYLAELERSIMQSDSAGGAYRKDYSTQTTSHQAQALIQVLRNSLYTFTVGFYDYFEALKLPANVGRQLQAFANFQA
ncbi:hypothetical protein GQ54DRAFT_304374 [Martensiomyces pterosporus]|nr:hypothetical protein GQ54DRAFT_304374 [Martensiomyces pterosporus]